MKHRILKTDTGRTALLALLALGACNTLGGIDEPILDNSVGQPGSGGGGGGATSCKPNETRPCYTGPQTTRGIGQCKEGVETCLSDGSAFGGCEGEVLPAASEDCTPDSGDEDCNGLANEYPICPCETGTSVACDSKEKGVCAKGSAVCKMDGTIDTCEALTDPSFDKCFTPEDEDCDGVPINSCTGTPQVSLDLSGQITDPMKASRIRGLAAIDNDYVAVGYVDGDAPSTNFFLTSSGTGFVTRVGSDGKHPLWTTKFSAMPTPPATSSYSSGVSVAVDEDKNVIVGGYFNGTLELSNGQTFVSGGGADLLVLKLNGADGTPIWARSFPLFGDDGVFDIAVDKDKNIIATGSTLSLSLVTGGTAPNERVFLVKWDTNGNEAWNRVFSMYAKGTQKCHSVLAMPDGDIVIAGDSTGDIGFGGGWKYNTGSNDIFMVRFDPGGTTVRWSFQQGGVNPNFARELALSKDEKSLLLAGLFQKNIVLSGKPFAAASDTSRSAYVAAFDATSGTFQRILYTGDVGGTVTSDMAVDGAGDIVISGWTDNTIAWGGTSPQTSGGMDDGYAVKIAWDDTTWTPRWIKMLGNSDIQKADAIAVDGLGRVIVGGWFNTKIHYGDLVPDGGSNGISLFAVRLDP